MYHREMEGKDIMQPPTAERTRLTYNDFLLFPDDGFRHELIDGQHYVTPCPNLRHQELVGRLHLVIGTHLEDRPDRGRVLLAPFDVVFSFYDVVEPDLIVVAPDQLEILTDANIKGTPAMVVEILSPSTKRRDLGIKRDMYARFGVREYCVIDPKLNGVTVFRDAADGRFGTKAVLTSAGNDILESPLLPGVSIPLSRLLR